MDTSNSLTSVLRRTLLSCLAISASLMLPAAVSAEDSSAPNIAYLLAGTWNGSGHQQGTQSDWSIRLNVSVDNDTAQFKISSESVNMTTLVIVTLPILFVYPFFQKYIIKGILIGAIKE